jgi:GAF domain-containing protein
MPFTVHHVRFGSSVARGAVDVLESSDVRAVLADVLVAGERGTDAADRLCVACLPLLGVDAAAVSVIDEGESRGTFGASDAAARLLDALQFTAGEGPCLEAAQTMVPVLVPDLHAQDEPRWPAFKDAAERAGVRAVFAMPILVGRIGLGALDLFRSVPGPLSATQMSDALIFADAAAQILLDLIDIGSNASRRGDPLDQWEQMASLSHLEVYRATGMIMAQLDLSPAAALVRLRAYAFVNELTAGEVAELVTSRRLRLEV